MNRALAFFGSIAGRVFLLLFVGVLAAASLALWFAEAQRQSAARSAHEDRMAQRVADFASTVASTPADLRGALLSGPRPGLRPAPVRGAPQDGEDLALSSRISALTGGAARAYFASPHLCAPQPPNVPGPKPPKPPPPPPPGPDPLGPRPPQPDCRLVSLHLPDGSTLDLAVDAPPLPRDARNPFEPAFLLPLALAVAALAYGVARLATAPVERLARAADALATDLDRPPLKERGPAEVARAARAFNRMQGALQRHVRDRTQMLAAISHDLKTPLTRLRLRLERVSPLELQESLIGDVGAMQRLIAEGLDLARSVEAEPEEIVDLDALLASLVDDAAETGASIAFESGTGAFVKTRLGALRRCLANLIDNALRYGGRTEVRSVRDGDGVAAIVRDFGPGIDPAQLQAVFEPFVRLENSRSRDTGGAGLGLTIARALADKAGARVELRNLPEGGLEARVQLQASP